MHLFLILLSALLLGATSSAAAARADEPSASRRRQQAQEFHLRAQERTGVLVPLYVYPADVHTNRIYNRLIDIKRQPETVPIWGILNPDSGPGDHVAANSTKA